MGRTSRQGNLPKAPLGGPTTREGPGRVPLAYGDSTALSERGETRNGTLAPPSSCLEGQALPLGYRWPGRLARAGGEGPELEVGEAGPDESRVAHLALAPGSYRLWCSLPQHDEWGMNVALAVNDG
jgi:hypothetical protein